MLFSRSKIVAYSVVALFATSLPARSAQPGESVEERLKDLAEQAAQRPEVARFLEEMAAIREANRYSLEEFRKHVWVRMSEYQLAPGGLYVMNQTGEVASGTPNSVLGGSLEYVDRATGKTQLITYSARINFSDDAGLYVDLSVFSADQPPKVTTHKLENFSPVSVVLREMPDQSRYVLQLSPLLEPKEQVLEYSEHLKISLADAILLVDDQLAGKFTCSGDYVGITSSKARLTLEFGLKAFKDALPIGKTNGRTIWFKIDDHSYELHNSRPIIAGAGDDSMWKVYIRSEAYDGSSDGTSAGSFGALMLDKLLKVGR